MPLNAISITIIFHFAEDFKEGLMRKGTETPSLRSSFIPGTIGIYWYILLE